MLQYETLLKSTIDIPKTATFTINKIGHTKGYDGHCLRAFSYFGDRMPDINMSVDSINSIATRYKKERQDSKAPTFALTYGGQYITLMNNCGFDKKTAKTIEKNYHDLYAVSDQWVKDKLDEAHKTGYVTCAFGLRLRTPILEQVLLTQTNMPFIAQKERRSAGNAVSGQSYGLLTTRAGIEFQERCLASKYKYDILPVAHIHDAIYLLVRDKPEIVKWVNDNLIECMSWQELPEIKHKNIKITSGLEIYWPNWSSAINVPNHASVGELKQIAKKAKE